jgi:spoIIIJ-associated protein
MSFLGRLFGGKKKGGSDIEVLINETLNGLLEKGGLDLDFDIKTDGENINIEFSGDDEDLLKDKEGQTIDAIQLFLKRVVQHNFPEDRSEITIDCNGFREESNQQLVELAEKLKGIALEKGKSVYFRALAPKDRKVIHQYLAGDARVKSRSIGDGLFKKIKIYPIKAQSGHEEQDSTDVE